MIGIKNITWFFFYAKGKRIFFQMMQNWKQLLPFQSLVTIVGKVLRIFCINHRIIVKKYLHFIATYFSTDILCTEDIRKEGDKSHCYHCYHRIHLRKKTQNRILLYQKRPFMPTSKYLMMILSELKLQGGLCAMEFNILADPDLWVGAYKNFYM